MWKTSTEIREAIETSHQRLLKGDSNTATASAEARLFGLTLKLLAVEMEHARRTGRLKEGSDVLPSFRSGTDAKQK